MVVKENLDWKKKKKRKYVLILDFPAIVNSQATVTTAKAFSEFADEFIKFIKFV